MIFDGAETAIVASEFDVTPNVVYVVMSRILKMLRTKFEPESPFGTMFDECTLVYLSPERFYFDWRKLVAADMQYRHGFLSRFDSIACGDVIEISRGQHIRNPANVGGKSDWRGNNTFDERLFHLGWETEPLEVLAECLSNGANVNATDHQGLTPLAIALEYRKYYLVEPLLRAGADPNSPNGITLSVACHRVKNDDGIRSVRQLIEAGADVQPCVSPLLNEDSNPWVDRILELVMPQNPDLELRNSNELTGLLVASASSNRDDLKNWIRWGADPQARTPCGATALMLSGHSLDKTRTLISTGLDVNATDDEGRTALIYAAAHTVRDATYSVIDLLLKAGADVTKCDSTGRKALDYALENEIALRLLDHVRKSWLEEEDANDPFIRALVATETVSYELGQAVAVRLLIERST